MGDLPDWTQAQADPATILFAGNMISGQELQLSFLDLGSVVVRMTPQLQNRLAYAQLEWLVDLAGGAILQTQWWTGINSVIDFTRLAFESPVYGGAMNLYNRSATTCAVQVVSSSRVAPSPRFLDEVTPGRIFTLTSAFAAGVGIAVPAGDIGPGYFVNNGQVQVACDCAVTGALFWTYIDSSGVTRNLTIGTVTGAVHFDQLITLPQGLGAFTYAIPAGSAGTTVTVFARAVSF